MKSTDNMGTKESSKKDRLNEAYRELVGRNVIVTKFDMAKKLGVPNAYIYQRFNGTTGIEDNFAMKLEEAYGVSAEWILFGRGLMMKTQRKSHSCLSE